MQVTTLAHQGRSVPSQQHEVDHGAWTAALLRDWLSTGHSLPIELALIFGLYAAYEATRGLVAGDERVALRHARDVISLERSLHIFVEGPIQHAALAVPGLIGTLGFAYLTLHLSLTGGLLLWLHRRRPAAYPLVRTTLLLASALAVIGYLVFPTAPPRLSDVGILDAVSGRQVDLNTGLVSSLYNPYAAVPSMHVGYALIVGTSIARHAPHLITRLAGLAYPPLVLLVIVATGNHFLVDAAAGAAVAGVALLAARLLVRTLPTPRTHEPPLTVWSATSTQNTLASAAEERAA
jgi:cytochrome bd-type quinol oxidase subunit 2